VVITDSEGNQLTSRTGPGEEKDFENLLKDAEKKSKVGAPKKAEEKKPK